METYWWACRWAGAFENSRHDERIDLCPGGPPEFSGVVSGGGLQSVPAARADKRQSSGRPVDTVGLYLSGEGRVGGDEQAKSISVRNSGEALGYSIAVWCAEMPVDDTPAGWQARDRSDHIGRAFRQVSHEECWRELPRVFSGLSRLEASGGSLQLAAGGSLRLMVGHE